MINTGALYQVGLGSLSSQDIVTTILPLALMIGIFYFGLIRPQKKKEKEVASMRDSLGVGDEIITIGGITGKVIQVKKDIIVLESSGMNTRLEVMKWGVHSVTKSKGKKETIDKETEEILENN